MTPLHQSSSSSISQHRITDYYNISYCIAEEQGTGTIWQTGMKMNRTNQYHHRLSRSVDIRHMHTKRSSMRSSAAAASSLSYHKSAHMTATSGHDSETSSPRSRRGSVYPARQSSCPVLSGSCVTVAQNYTRKTQTRDRYRGGLKRVCSVQQPSHQGKEGEEEEEEGENIVAAVDDDQAAEGAAQSESLEASSSESSSSAAASMDRSYNTPGGGTEGKGAVQDASGAAKESLVQVGCTLYLFFVRLFALSFFYCYQ